MWVWWWWWRRWDQRQCHLTRRCDPIDDGKTPTYEIVVVSMSADRFQKIKSFWGIIFILCCNNTIFVLLLCTNIKYILSQGQKKIVEQQKKLKRERREVVEKRIWFVVFFFGYEIMNNTKKVDQNASCMAWNTLNQVFFVVVDEEKFLSTKAKKKNKNSLSLSLSLSPPLKIKLCGF